MQTGARRKLDMAIVGGGSLLVGGVAAIGAFAGNTERVMSLWAGAQLRTDGTAAISEVVDYEFGNAQGKHGIYRDVPGLDPRSHIVVSSPNAPDALAILQTPPDSPSYPATRLRIGDAGQTVSGRHRYDIAYDLGTVQPAGALEWDAIGAAWPVPIEQTDINVVAPWEFTGTRCVKGTRGSTAPCTATQTEPGHLVIHTGKLDAGEGVTIFAAQSTPLPAAPALTVPTGEGPSDKGTGLGMPAGIGGGGGGLPAAPASFLVRRRGRERVSTGGATEAAWADGTSERLIDSAKLAEFTTIEFAPPSELSPPQGGIVLTEEVRSDHKVAWLVTEAIKGSIDIVEENAGQTVRLRRLKVGDRSAAPVLDVMFGNREELELGSFDETFAVGWSELDTSLRSWMRSSDLWDPAGDRRRTTVRALGIIAGVVGAVVAAGSAAIGAVNGAGWLWGVAAGSILAGAGLACAVRAWELKVRTPAGTGLWLRVESFRRFLAESEAYHAEQAAARGVLREYTAWAVAVGEIDRWTRAMTSAVNIPDRTAIGYAYIVPALVVTTSSSSTAPSSSGGGGDGGFGGGVGGGGGGGGGGSW